VSLGFTGTRQGLTQPQANCLRKALDHYAQFYEIMHNGDCIGADEYAGNYWSHLGKKLWLHPPTVASSRANLSAAVIAQPKPYLRRNMEIVMSADIILACPQEEAEVLRSGTWATIRYAIEAGKPLFIIHPSGSVKEHKPQ
jgi:hypothetical protein